MPISSQSLSAMLTLQPSEKDMLQLAAADPVVVATQLSEQVMAYEQANRLGYYPALSWFEENNAVDKDLVETLHSLAWLASQRTGELIRTRLRPIFSQVEIHAIQPVAYTMPVVRPGQNNVPHTLAEHYRPDVLRCTLKLSMLLKKEPAASLPDYARKMLWKWLREVFETMEVSDVRCE